MNTSLSLLPGQWRSRGAMSSVLLTVGVVLLRATRNDHWSATAGLALGQVAISAGAWSLARPILSTGLVALGQQQWQTLRPSLLLLTYTVGLVVFTAPFTVERALVAVYLALPGLVLDALLRWHEGQERHAVPPPTVEQEQPDDHHRA